MSLIRQLWLAVIASTLIAFSGSFIVSMLTARNYLEKQLSTKNADNASSLALSITQLPKDPITIELQVSALYDSGQYELVRLTAPDGKVLIEKQNSKESPNVPAWFIKLFPIVSYPGTAQISNGWSQFAQIELVSHNRYAYQELWRGGIKLLLWFVVGGALIGLIGTFIIRGLRKPLNAVVSQAEAISHRRFNKIAIPRTPELKSVAEAMNTMVERLQAMFNEEGKRLEQVRQEANFDKLTSLANRSHFLNQLESVLIADESHPEGLAVLLRVGELTEINRQHGRETSDDLLRQTGSLLTEIAGKHVHGLAGRLNGGDFALLLPNVHSTDEIGSNLMAGMRNLGIVISLNGLATACAGVSPYHQGDSISNLLGRLDEALATAENQGAWSWSEVTPATNVSHPANQTEWHRFLQAAVQENRLRLVRFPLVDANRQLLHYECPLRLQLKESEECLTAGVFMPMATRLNMTGQLDLAAIRLAFARIREDNVDVSINLSSESLGSRQFTLSLYQVLLEHQDICQRLWLEIPESGAFRQFQAFKKFCLEMQPLGCKVGIEHFGHQFSGIGQLPGLGLDFLKIESSFIRNIDQQEGNQTFLKGVCTIAHNIGLKVFAEGVQNEQEIATLLALGFDGMTGPGVTVQ